VALIVGVALLEVCSRKISRGITMSQYLALVPAPPKNICPTLVLKQPKM
jgi:hypothetical protein